MGHTYTFGASPKFASAWDEMMKRRKAKTQKKRNKRRKGAEVQDDKKI
jgi:hypothetical protein